MTIHTCHALNCSVMVHPSKLMCRVHWAMVPKSLQQKVWSTYRQGQENDKNPSADYLQAAKEAIQAVADKENA